MKPHIRNLAICLGVAILIFAVCAYGLTTGYYQYATIGGLVLVFVMTVIFFYATLHLSKTR